MEITRCPLSQRICLTREGKVSQPEYLPALIRQWMEMPIKAYFGSCTEELRELYFFLNLAPEDNPSYGAVANMIVSNKDCPFGGLEEEATELLAAPVRAHNMRKKERQK